MKKKLHKDLWKKAVVLGITLVFVFGAFFPAVTSQIGSITASQSLEESENEKIPNIGAEESVDEVVSDDSMDSESDVSKTRDGSLWNRLIQIMFGMKNFVSTNPIVNRLRELFTRRDMSDDADDVDHDEKQMSDDQLNSDKQTKNLNPRLDQSRDNLDPAPLDTGDPWWNTGWSNRKEITIDQNKVTDSLTNFPVLVSLSGDPNLASIAQSSGDDIVFTNQDGTVVFAHEIDYYSSGTLDAWVNVTSLSSSVDTVLYMYFGNATCSNQENPTGVWDDGFVMVQHMQETSGTHYDSTSNNNDAAEYVSPDSNMDTTGKIAGADFFDTGGDDFLEVTGDLVTGDGNTISFWEYEMTIGTGFGCIIDDFSTGGFLWQFGTTTTFQIGSVDSWGHSWIHGGLVDGTWHHYTATLSGGTISVYENGSLVNSQSYGTTVAADGQDVRIMGRSDGNYATGKLDELRISNTVRSADWIETSYNNQYEPDSFFDVGPLEPPLPWWNREWQYRKEITIDNTKVAGDLTDFPALISLTGDSDLAANAQSNGEDIVFVDQNGLKLDHEIEYYDNTAGDLDCWVELPSLFGSSDTVLYMYYGNGTCPSQENPSGVWDSNFVMVQHMQETSGTHYDITTNNHDASEYVSPDSNMDTGGIIAGSDWFDGSDDYLEVSGDLVSGDGNTVSFWEYNMTIGTGYGSVYDDWSGSAGLLWQFGDNPTDFQVGNVGDWGNNLVYVHGGLVDDTWHYYTVTLEGDHIRLYEDGSLVAFKTHNTNVAADADDVQIMRRSDGHYTTGKMDELRVSNVNRSAEWIETCYMNQYEPDSFFDIGDVEIFGMGLPPVVSEESPAGGAVDVSVSLTSLSFKLNDTDSNLMNYTVETVPNIGSGGVNEVPNGTYSVSVSGLSPFTTYVWYVNVTDGNYDVNESYSFTTETLSVFDPSICGWGYQKKITIDHNLVADTLSNFPVLVDITDSDLSNHAQTDGDDIVFMDACGNANLLAHEIELFDGGSGHLVAWVNVPSVSSASDTELYMYYGNPTSSNVEDKTGVWANGYELVTHHNEASGLVYDSTSNGYTGSKIGGVTQNVAGKSAGGDHFDGTSSYLSFGDVCDVTSGGATWSLWVNHDSTKAHRYFGKGAGGILVQWFWSVGPPEQAHIEVGNVGDWGGRATYVTPQDSGNWHYLTYVFDDSDSKYKIYLDGSFGVMGPASSLPVDNGDSFVIGSGYIHESYAFTHGTIDEARVSSSVRNASWIATCYNNQYSPSGFYSVSDEMSAGAPDVSDPVPSDGAIGVSTSLSQLEFTISDCQGDSMTYTVGTVPDVGGGGSGGSVSDGTYTVPVSGLAAFTSYIWYVNVSDGTNYNNVSYTFSTQAAASFDPSLYGWQYQRQLIVDSSLVVDDLTDYPLLVSMVDADLGAHARSDGQDIIFMDGCGGSASLLDYEIETFDHTTGELVAWVKIPSLSSSMDTELFMFYGKSDAPPLENVSGVWDSNYLMVQHLEETSGTHYDSTDNDCDGTKAGGVTQGVSGKINHGDHLDGTGYVSFGDVCDISSGGATWSCWVKLDMQGIHRIIGKGSTGLLVQWYDDLGGSSQLQAGYVGIADANWSARAYTSMVQDTEWHLFTTVFNDTSSKFEIFFDGVFLAEGTDGDLPVDNGDSFVLGSGYTHDHPMTGYLDEFRVSDVKRSSVWIATCYANQDDPSGFVRIGGETAAGAPVISDVTPMDGATAVSATLSQLSFSLADCQGDTMTYTVETLPNIGSGGDTVSDGSYNVPISGLQYETTYTWFVNVTDATNWNNETFTFTTRPMILLSNPSPLDGGVWALYNPMLEIDVDHDAAAPLTIKFLTNASGSWEEIYSYTNSGGGIYTARSSGMTTREKRFFWRVNASDGLGNFSEETYDFYMVHFVGDAITPVARSFCCKFGYIGRARETGIAYVTTQQADHPGPYGLPEDIPHYAKYDINQGWVETYEFLFNSGNAFHPFWGYWDDEYHFAHGQGGAGCKLADSPTWEGFQSMDFHSVWYTVGPRSDTNPTPSCYSFDNDNAWIISSDEGYHVMKYWPWNSTTGWGSPVSIEATRTTLNLDAGQILQINKTTWLLYYAQCSGADILYVKTTDAGQTWSGPFDPSIPTTTSSCNRVSFAQYGNNYYMFVTDGGAVIYNSTDGENWANRQVIYSGGSIVHHGCLLHQSALISTHAGSGDPSDQYGILTVVDEMVSDPGKPSDPDPADDTLFSLGTTSTTLSVTVQGDQVYDIAFYWANGTFIGEEKLLEEGDVASVTVSGLLDNTAYEWYAVCRGATGLYAGFEPLCTSDENCSDMFSFSVGLSDAPKISSENPVDGTMHVPVSTSELSFDLADDQGDSMTYTVTTVPNIGSGGATVGNGSYSVSVSGLDYATMYTWDVNVTDGIHWTNKTFTFTTELGTTFDPFAKGWSYRKKIVIDHMKVTTDLTNFPVLVNVTDGDLASKAESDGSDIMFMDGSGVANRLNHEIEYYDGGSGYLVAWVNVTSVSSSIDTELYMYYGKATGVSYENIPGVWDSSYRLLQHLSETSGTHYDSTTYSNDGTCHGGVTQNAVGMVDGADSFDGTDDYIDCGNDPSLDVSVITIEAWIKPTHMGDDWQRVLAKETSGNGADGYGLYIHKDGIIYLALDGVVQTSSVSIPGNTSTYVVCTADGSNEKIYVNGALLDTFSNGYLPGSSSTNLYLGKSPSVLDRKFNGIIDEVRISNPVRSAGWINTSFVNQHSPMAFMSFESEESADPPIISNPNPSDGESNVAVTLTDLNFTLSDFQGDSMTYYVTTFPDIGSDSATVGNGTYDVSVSGLSYNTLYTWYVNVTDSGSGEWTNRTFTFTTESAPAGWWNTEWLYRKEIVIDHSQVSATLSNYPVLIELTDVDLSSKAQSDGNDIVFIDYLGNKLNHEIELYTDVSGELVAWVNVTSLSSTEDTVLYMYYGNGVCSNQQNPTGVWDSNYVTVQHLQETSGTHYDSTSYDNDGTPYGGLNQNVIGKIDGADDFDGSGDYVGISDVSSLDFGTSTDFTLSAWINTTDTSNTLVVDKRGTPTMTGYMIALFPSGGGYWKAQVKDSSGTTILVSDNTNNIGDGNYHLLTAVYDRDGNLAIYVDGSPVDSTSITSISDVSNAGDLFIGACIECTPDTAFFNGIIDEVRISNVARTNDWISTCYNNQNSPSGFYTVGSEEIGVGAPLISNPSPANGATNVPITTSSLSITIEDMQGDSFNWTIQTSPDVGSSSGLNEYNDTKTCAISGLSYDTTYTWFVNATDSGSGEWTNNTYTFITETAPGSWWNTEWPFRKEISIDYNQVTGPLANFPTLIKLSDSDLNSKAQTNGEDLVFTDFSGNKLNHEIEYYNSGELVVWVNVTSLSSTENTILYMYYGNTTCSSQENPESVWDANYVLVQHLDETSGTHYDSTSYNNDGTPSGGVNQNAVGTINGCDSFDGLDDHIAIAATSSLDFSPGSSSFETWMNANDNSAEQVTVQQERSKIRIKTSTIQSTWHGGTSNLDSGISPTNNQWYHVVVTNDGTTQRIYVDGVLKDSDTFSYESTTGVPVSISHPSVVFNGEIDEVRISNVERSADWVETSYNNQYDPDSFFDIGVEESSGVNYVILNSPLDETLSEWTIDFTFTPMFSDSIVNASLYTNESGIWQKVETIYSVTENTANIITHTFSHSYPYLEEGTYEWNVEVWNSTVGVFAASNSTVTIDIPPRHRNAGSSTTNPIEGTPLSLYAQGYDGIGLDSAWLATDESGTWMNYTMMEETCSGNGTVCWTDYSRSTQRGIIYNGKLYDTEGGAIYIRNWTTMQVLDTHSIGGWTNVAPALDYENEEIVYAACGSNGRVVAYNTTSKSEVWRKTFDTGLGIRHIETGDLFLDEGHLFVLVSNFTVLKLDKTNGNTVGTFHLNDTHVDTGSKMITVDTENNRIYAVGHARFHCINSTDMTEIWNATITVGSGDGGRSAPMIVDDEGVYSIHFGTLLGPEFGVISTGYIYSFDYDGNENWNVSIPGGVRAHISYSPRTKYLYVTDFYQYYGSQTNHLYTFNRTTSAQIWKVTAPRNDHFMRPLTLVGDIGLFHTNNGYGHGGGDYLYLFNATDGTFFGEVPYTGDALCYPVLVSEGKAITGGGSCLIQFDLGKGEPVDSKHLWGSYRNGYTDAEALTCYGKDVTLTPKYYGSPMDINGISDQWVWTNFTWQNDDITAGTTVNWRIYYNDTMGNINATEIKSFTVRELSEPIIYNPVPADGAENIPITTSSLSVTIDDPQGESFNWYIETSPDVGSNSGTDEYNGSKTCTISGLSYDTTYTWYVNATDSGSGLWTNETYTFTTEQGPGSWWNTNWDYRKQITIDHENVSNNLINFPLLIKITDTDLTTKAQDDGDDLVFTDYSADKLHHEIELYDNTTGNLVCWVNVTSLSSTEDTVLYMYYGNGTCADQQNPTGVWDSSYRLVQHLSETSGTHYDSTAYSNDGTCHNGVDQNAVGMIDGADSLDGSDDYIDCGNGASLDLSVVTIEAWVKPTLTGDDWQRILAKETSGNGAGGYGVYIHTDGIIHLTLDGDTQLSSSPLPANTWSHIVCTADGTNEKIYVNGILLDTFSDGYLPGSSSANLYLGKSPSIADRKFTGLLDEIRVSNPVRDEDWIQTSYFNQYEPDSFFDIGSEETVPGEDTTPPEVTDIIVTMSDPIDTDPLYGWENITCTVTDNVDVDEVYLNITYPDLHTESHLMIDGGGGQYYYNTTYTSVGSYSYHIWAKDTSDNSNMSTVDTFEIPPNYDVKFLVEKMIDISDLNAVCLIFGSPVTAGSIREDVNNDGFIDISDLNQVCLHFGESWP